LSTKFELGFTQYSIVTCHMIMVYTVFHCDMIMVYTVFHCDMSHDYGLYVVFHCDMIMVYSGFTFHICMILVYSGVCFYIILVYTRFDVHSFHVILAYSDFGFHMILCLFSEFCLDIFHCTINPILKGHLWEKKYRIWHRQNLPCLALFAGVWFYFSLLSAVFSFMFVFKQCIM
jgi:hypothetical protein